MDGLEALCGCCEVALSVADGLGSPSSRRRDDEAAQEGEDPALAARREAYRVRNRREHRRGVRIEFLKRRVADVVFLEGENRGRRASEMDDMELKRLAVSMKNRTARFALRRYLVHRKKGRVPPPSEPVIRR